MSSSTVERRDQTAGARPPQTGTLWERCVAMALLWSIPVVAFALVMYYGGAQAS